MAYVLDVQMLAMNLSMRKALVVVAVMSGL
jgi:hypothetical protein